MIRRPPRSTLFPYNDALPISTRAWAGAAVKRRRARTVAAVSSGKPARSHAPMPPSRSEEHTSELQSQSNLVCRLLLEKKKKTHSLVHVPHPVAASNTHLHVCR